MKKELELYIHIPFCMKKCNYCDFLSAPADESTQDQYVDALLKEIQYFGTKCRDREVSTIYIGGGTPSWLQERNMERILSKVQQEFYLQEKVELTVECNPGTVTREKLMLYQNCGVNRLSFGLQSAMNDELRELGRVHTYEQFLRNYELSLELGFKNINIDIMSALPYQSTPKFITTLKRVLNLRPTHISAYSLMIEKGTPFYDKYKFDAVKREAGMATEILPSEETEYEIYRKTQEILVSHGYHHYEISNYAKPGYECRHNMGYWMRTEYLGLGLGASSLLDNIRYMNERELYDYIKKAENILPGEVGKYNTNLHISADVLDRNSQMEEFMFLGLRMSEGISRERFRQEFGVEIEAVYADQLQQLVEEELLICQAGRIYLSKRGQDISNYVLSNFLL